MASNHLANHNLLLKINNLIKLVELQARDQTPAKVVSCYTDDSVVLPSYGKEQLGFVLSESVCCASFFPSS